MKLTLLIILAYSNLIFTDVVENLYEIKNPKPARILFVGNSLSEGLKVGSRVF